jgi:predicted component of type VI protein secretion system
MGRDCASAGLPPRSDARSGLSVTPLGQVNWQMTQRTAFEMRNKTGSDVHIAASAMVG